MSNNLAYLIQQVTKDSTQEILAYFHGISSFVLDDVAKKSKASWINKEIVLFYKETAVTYKIQIRGGNPKNANSTAKVKVTFPNVTEEKDVAELMTQVMETGLGLADEKDLPKFVKPELKTPACLKQVRLKQNESRES